MRLIDADALINFLDETVPYDEMLVSQYNADWIYSFIECAPTIEARPVVHGRWVDLGRNYYTVVSQCSECGAKYDFRSPYCPNCGAEMRTKEEE